MKEIKKTMVEAYSTIYDIEMNLRFLLKKDQRYNQKQIDSNYWQIINLAINHNIRLDSKQKTIIRKTIPIRNKICHMKSINEKELEVLKYTLITIEKLNRKYKWL